jgi:hypothetical protein
MSADIPRIKLEVEVVGADGTVNDLEKVADAQDDVADAAGKAADKIEDAGKAAEKGGGKLSKLWAGLKAGSGAAASASAGLAGMAATLNGDLSEANKQAVAGLQGLSGVLGAFGPVGQLLATGVSLAAGAIATFGESAEEAAGPSRTLSEEFKALGDGASFLAKAMGPAILELKRFAAEQERLKQARDASVGIFGVPIEQVPERWSAAAQAMQGAITQSTSAMQAAQGELDSLRARRETLDILYYNRELARLEGVSEVARREVRDRKAALQGIADAYKAANAPLGPEPPPGGLPTPSRGGGPRGPTAEQLEAEAHAARQRLALGFQAFDAKRRAATEAARAQMAAYSTFAADAQAQAFYSGMLDSAIATGTAAQVDSLRAIAAEAEGVAGVYDTLTGALQSFGTTAADSFANAAANALLFGGSLGEMVNEVTKALALQATVEAIKATATGLGYLAAGLFGYGPGLAAAQASFASAALWGGIAAGSAGIAAATGGLASGGGGGMSNGGQGPSPSDLGRPRERDPGPVDREFNINLASGAGGARPLSRGDARAVAGALVDIFAQGGLRLETSRA